MRGEIKYLERYKQLISYAGMELTRKITPTDIDGFIDLKGKCFIYIEGKLINKELDYGQRLALENVVKSHEKADHKSIAIIFRLNSKPDDLIDAKSQIVSEVYLKYNNNYKWRKPPKVNLLTCLLNYIKWIEKIGIDI